MSDDNHPRDARDWFYICYPPKEPAFLEDIRETVVITHEDMPPERTPGVCLSHVTAEDGDPVSFVKSLLYAHEEQAFPPVRVMAWLAAGFAQWMESDGQTRLEDCLGLREPHKRQASNALKQANKRNQILTLMVDVLRWRIGFGLTVNDAVTMSLESEWGRGYGFNTVFEAYKDWPGKHDELWIDIFTRRIDDEMRKQILSSYPRRTYKTLVELAKKYDKIARNMPAQWSRVGDLNRRDCDPFSVS